MANLAQVLDPASSNGEKIVAIFEELGLTMYDANGQLKSGYDLLSDLAKEWKNLDGNTQKYIATTIAGTTQLNNFLALMNNFGHATEATATAIDSAGSATRENERYMEGLEAKTQALKSSFQQLAASVVNSGLVKGILDLANAFLQLLNTPFGTFVTQVTLLTGLLWGGSGLIKAMSVIPAFFAKAAVGAKGLAAALSLTGPQFALIAAAIAGLIIVMPKVVDWFKKWNDDIYAAESDLKDYNDELERNKTRLEEINKIPYKNRTSEIKEEEQALKNRNIELEKSIDLRQKDLEAAKFERLLSEKHETSGQFVYTSPEISGTGDYGEVRDESGYELFVADSEQALNRLVELGRLTEEQVKETLAKVNNDASMALQELGYTLIEGYGDMAPEEYYKGIFSQLEAVKGKMQSGQLDADTLDFYNELKNILDNLFDSAKNVEDSGLDSWVIELRDDFSNLIKTTKGVTDGVYSTTESMYQLEQGFKINQVQYDQLIDKFPELVDILEDVGDGFVSDRDKLIEFIQQMNSATTSVSSLDSTYSQLIQGMGVSERQINELLSVYPQLNGLIHQNKDAYYLDTQALIDNANNGADWANTMIHNQSAVTDETIRQVRKRMYALLADLQAAQAGSSTVAERKRLAELAEETRKKLQSLSELSGETSNSGKYMSGGSGSSSGGGGGSKPPKPVEEDPLAKQAKQFKENIELMEHKLFLMEKENASEEDRISQLRKIQDEIDRQKKWFYDHGLDQNSKYIQDLEKQWWEYEDQIKNLYKDQADIYEMLFGAVANKAQDEIDVLEKKKQEIQNQNNELEKQIALEKALDALARAKQQKVLVYKDGKMQYVEDVDAVSKAQEAVDQAKREQDVNQQLEDIDKQINKWEEMKDQWSSVTTEYQKQQDLLLIEQKLGIKLEGENWEQRLSSLQTYINRYNDLMGKATGLGPVNMSKSRILTRGMRPVASGSPSPVVMMRMGVPSPASMMSTYNADPFVMNQSPNIVIENFNPSLPNVTDGEGFAAYLKNNFWGQTLQLVKT